MKMERISSREAVDRLRKAFPKAQLIAYQGEESVNPDYPRPKDKGNRGPSARDTREMIVSLLVVNVIFWGAVWLLWRWMFG